MKRYYQNATQNPPLTRAEFLRRPPEGICYYSRDAFQESAS